MSELPEPLAPADLNVQGYDYMPLHGTRLFNSEFYTLALRNPRAGLAAQKLWWVAWQQSPAGSLPDNEHALCRFADFGTDMRAWKRAREVAMHGFELCSDGRYYHPVIVEEVVQPYSATVAKRPTAPTAGSVVVGLDCDYVCSRHRRKERHFEVVVGKVIDAHGVQHRFAYPQRPSGFGRGVQAA